MIFSEVKILQSDAFADHRGELWTLWEKSKFFPKLEFNHDKVSVSKKGVLRGLHYDTKSWKLITCISGEIQLVIVDCNKNSVNYLKHDSIILTSENKISVLVPPNFANGHLVLSEQAIFHYKWAYDGEYPDVEQQKSLNWADPELKINWMNTAPILSERDRNSKFITKDSL